MKIGSGGIICVVAYNKYIYNQNIIYPEAYYDYNSCT